MTLKDWLTAKCVSVSEFALQIGRKAETVRRYTTGERIPDKETMPLIVEHTGGEVTPNDFFGVRSACDTAPDSAAA